MARRARGTGLTKDPRCVITQDARPDLRPPVIAAGAPDDFSPHAAAATPPAILPPQALSPTRFERSDRGPPPRRVLIDPRRAPRAPPTADVCA
jgi:hypothetical protein